VEFFNRAAIGLVSGQTILMVVLIFAVMVLLVGFGTVGLQDAAGEVLPRFGAEVEGALGKRMAWFRPSRRRLQLLTLIITDQHKEVSDRILKDMRRGVTAIPGTGMYTGKDHSILMCAVTVTEIPQIKDLVAQVDPARSWWLCRRKKCSEKALCRYTRNETLDRFMIYYRSIV
jgi:uncharacterized membrane-anchored protein YitT (DUF2179 family)